MLKLQTLSKPLSIFTICICLVSPARAQEYIDAIAEPLLLEEVQIIKNDRKLKYDDEDSSSLEIRTDAMREAALSYGAMSGMLHRNWEITQILEKDEIILDAVFNFSRLMIPTHYGALIEPPIISESENAFLLSDGGMSASMTSKVYSIGENSRIVTTSRNWREYLMDYMDLGSVEKPDTILRPRNKSEMKQWKEFIKEGWIKGVEQSNDIFADKLDLLLADYVGMIRYKKLLAQKMVSKPYAVKENRGITGGDNELRIDDKAVIITSIPALNSSSENWEPTER